MVLDLEDLPAGFEEVSPDDFDFGPGDPSMVDSVPIETAFAFSDDERFEFIAGFTVILPSRTQQIEFDEDMATNVGLFLMGAAGGMGVEDLPDLQIGDASAGMAIEMPGEGGEVLRLEAVLFRRGGVGAFLFAMRMAGDAPGAPIGDLARTLDERTVEALASAGLAEAPTDGSCRLVTSFEAEIDSPWLRNVVTLDGRLTTVDEWSDAACVDLVLTTRHSPGPTGSESVLTRWWIKNDGEWVYLLARVPAGSEVHGAYIAQFWGEYGPPWDYSDEAWIDRDGIADDGYGWNDEEWFSDAEASPPGQNNAEGAVTAESDYVWFEFRKALHAGDGYDWDWAPGDVIVDNLMVGIVSDTGAGWHYIRPLRLSSSMEAAKFDVQNVELDLWHTQAGAQEALLDEIVADFNASNQYGIQVNAIRIEGGYDQIYEETVAGLATGDVPDLVVAYPSMVAEYVQAGAPLDLWPYIEDEEYGLTDEELRDIYPVYVEDNTYPAYGDQTLSWPFHKSVLIMYASVTLLQEAGVTEMPETWDAFHEACKMVQENTDAETCWSIHIDASDVDGLMASVGVYPQADPETLTSKLDDPRFVEWCQLLQKMVDEGLARPEAERYSGDDEIAAGDAAFTTASSSSLGYFPRNRNGSYAIEWQVIPLPHAQDAEPANLVYGANIMAVREDDPGRDLAKWLFIKYWTSRDAAKKWVTGTDEIPGSSYLPLHRSALDDPEFAAYVAEHPRYGEAVGCLDDGVIEPQLAGQQAVRAILEDVYVKILNGEDVRATLEGAAQRASEAFQRWAK
jgi:multiple sugar transport system substrate-binding protein